MHNCLPAPRNFARPCVSACPACDRQADGDGIFTQTPRRRWPAPPLLPVQAGQLREAPGVSRTTRAAPAHLQALAEAGRAGGHQAARARAHAERRALQLGESGRAPRRQPRRGRGRRGVHARARPGAAPAAASGGRCGGAHGARAHKGRRAAPRGGAHAHLLSSARTSPSCNAALVRAVPWHLEGRRGTGDRQALRRTCASVLSELCRTSPGAPPAACRHSPARPLRPAAARLPRRPPARRASPPRRLPTAPGRRQHRYLKVVACSSCNGDHQRCFARVDAYTHQLDTVQGQHQPQAF
jgi:hypothetical protein